MEEPHLIKGLGGFAEAEMATKKSKDTIAALLGNAPALTRFRE